MKTLKNPLLLVLVWFISILALCLSFIAYSKEHITFENIVGGSFLYMIYAAVFSLPAFIFFFMVSFFTLRTGKLSVAQKRLVMCLANVLDILLTFGALYSLMIAETINHNSAQQLAALKNLFYFYPLWVLIIISNALIVLLPFNFNKPIR